MDGYLQESFLFTAVKSQDLMGHKSRGRRGEFAVYTVDGLVLTGNGRNDRGIFCVLFADLAADICVVGDLFGNDVGSAGQSLFCCVNAFFLVDKFCGKVLGSGDTALENGLCKGSETFFCGNCGAGTALLLIGAVNILDFGKGLCVCNGF